MLAVDESLFAQIQGTTDTEVLFHLALTFGLADDPPGAVAGRSASSRRPAGRRGIKYPFQGTIAVTNGHQIWSFRYSTEGKSRSLFYTRDVPNLREHYPDNELLREVSDDARLVVSEPIGDLPGAWVEMPESTYSVISGGSDEILPFAVQPPA